jgi:hypothetical protein
LSQSAHAQRFILPQADSLFLIGQYQPSAKLYEKYLNQIGTTAYVPTVVYYKLAYAAEQRNDYARALYYLSVIYGRSPRQSVLNQLSEIAAAQQLSGYESDDLGFVIIFFRRYALYFILFLLIVGIYAYGVLIYKKSQGQYIRQRHKWIVSLYLTGLLLLLHLPEAYQIAIVNQEKAYLRQAPSSAAPVQSIILKGNKVNVLSSQDEWLRIWWNKQVFFIRKRDVWVVS